MNFRDRAIEILELISSFAAQVEYERNVPIANVPAEMLCMWFDDYYHVTPKFKESFSAEELTTLEQFNSFFDSRTSKLPSDKLGLNALQNSPVWKEISVEAKQTLNKIKLV